MSLPISIEALLESRGVEQSRIEYKRSWNPDECIRTLCAFANDVDNQDGGYLILGVEEENGRPKLPVAGIDPESIDRIQKDLLNKCHFIEPFYHPRVELCESRGKTLMVLWAPAGSGRPYKASKYATRHQAEKEYYIRRGSNSVVADEITLHDLFEQSCRIPFDDRENPFAHIENLSLDLMRSHLYRVGSNLYELSANMALEEVASNMRLVTGPTENLRPRNVALLMFSNNPQRYFPYARIEVVDMPDITGRGMTEKVFVGPIQAQLEDALEYIGNYMLEERIDKSDGRVETLRAWNYPLLAIKELLSNAVYHRDYQIPEPITLVKYPDCIEIKSFPGLDRSITDQMIRNATIRSAGCYRNRRIGNILKELGLTEGRNTGVPTALRSLAENGSGRALFITDEDRQSLTVRIPVHPLFCTEGTGSARRRGAGGLKSERKTRTRQELRREVLVLLSAGDFSARGIAEQLGYSTVSKTLREVLEDLVADGIVHVSGVNKSRRYGLARR